MYLKLRVMYRSYVHRKSERESFNVALVLSNRAFVKHTTTKTYKGCIF